jgi:hypothetical protein
MTGFQAVILICLNSVPSDQCTEATATDVLSKHVETELGCASGWQEVIGRSAQAYEIGHDAYVRTICRRSGAVAPRAEQ